MLLVTLSVAAKLCARQNSRNLVGKVRRHMPRLAFVYFTFTGSLVPRNQKTSVDQKEIC